MPQICFSIALNGVSLRVLPCKTCLNPWTIDFLSTLTIFKAQQFLQFEFNHFEVKVREIVLYRKCFCVTKVPHLPRNQFYVNLVSHCTGLRARPFSTDKVRTASYLMCTPALLELSKLMINHFVFSSSKLQL